MTLEEFTLTYKDSDGNIVITIADYFERFVKPLSPKFANSSFHTSRTVICCFKDHDDINPSLGTTNHRHLKGVKVYHCFGCGRTGTVIRLHQLIQHEYHNRRLSDKEAALELCDLFGVDASKYREVKDAGAANGYLARMQRADEVLDEYTLAEFKDELRDIRARDGLMLVERGHLINSAMIKMIATSKRLYDK